jgi:hypothetical protein
VEETTYFAKGNLRVTDQQISTKKDTVLVRDISAVQVKTSAGGSLFMFLLAGVCSLFAYGASLSGSTGIMLVCIVLAILFVGTALSGRNVVVTTHGGKQIEVASGLVGEMRQVKEAISRAMMTAHAA